MQIIISDSSCLIGLKKIGLLEDVLKLPYEIAVPDIMLSDELLSFSANEINSLKNRGLKSLALAGDGVKEAIEVNRQNAILSIYDCFAFILVKITPENILLTGDKRLRSYAENQGLIVHGLLWILEEVRRFDIISSNKLLKALLFLQSNPLFRLPPRTLQAMISKYQ